MTGLMGWRGVAVTKRLIFSEDKERGMFRQAGPALSLCYRFAPAGMKLERSDSAADLRGSPVGLDRFCWRGGRVPACELPALISPKLQVSSGKPWLTQLGSEWALQRALSGAASFLGRPNRSPG